MLAETRDRWLRKRWMRPLASLVASPLVWRFNRRGVARGVALGLFAGFAVPFAQTPFAALFALSARANLPVAAACTMVTNPFTLPVVYYLAYRSGSAMLRADGGLLPALPGDGGLLDRGAAWLLALAGPTYLGLLLFAIVGAVGGWIITSVGWRFLVARRWRRRRLSRLSRPAMDPQGLPASCHEFG